MKEKSVRKILTKSSYVLFVIAFGFISLNILFADKIHSYKITQLLPGMIVGGVVVAIGMFILSKIAQEKIDRHFKKVLILFSIVYYIILIRMGFLLRFTPSFDMDAIYSGAIQWTNEGNFSNFYEYFGYFPNNLGSMGFLHIVFKIASLFGIKDFFAVGIIVNSALITGTAVIVSLICEKIAGSKTALMSLILVLLCFILYIISAHAQYCSIKKGRTAYYVTTEVKEGKTLKDTMCIADVVDKGDRLIIREDAFGEHYDSLSIKSGINRLFYIYHKSQDMTEVILLDGKSEYEYQKYSKNIYAEGRISIPLKDHVQNGDDIPQCNFLQKSGPMTMKASLKGKYKGRETIHTPAGDFDCIKIYTEQKGKVMFISETEYSIDWYAKNIGLVKSETITKKGKVISTTLLYAIKE